MADAGLDVGLVSRLIARQFPQWADLTLRPVASTGTDNAIFRLGEALAVRLPRDAEAAAAIAKEQTWLPGFADRLPLDIPAAMGLGEPAEGHGWCWGICRWVEGRDAADGSIADDAGSAAALGRFLTALRRVDPAVGPRAGPLNNYRGVALRHLDQRVRGCLAQLAGDIDTVLAAEVWEAGLAANVHEGPRVWIHGDLHPGNLVARDGLLAGVIDFGLLGVGDPAADLMAGWTVFSASVRGAFLEEAGADPAARLRARAWALYSGVVALPFYRERNPTLAGISRRTLGRVLDGP